MNYEKNSRCSVYGAACYGITYSAGTGCRCDSNAAVVSGNAEWCNDRTESESVSDAGV